MTRIALAALLVGLMLNCLGCGSSDDAAPVAAPTPPPAGGAPAANVKTSPGEMPPPPGVQVPSSPR